MQSKNFTCLHKDFEYKNIKNLLEDTIFHILPYF